MELLEVLTSDAFYTSTIGSRANSERHEARLRLFDLGEQQIERLHAPVGLYVGAHTPPEIAVSIIAEMTAIRRNVFVLQQHSMRARCVPDSMATAAAHAGR
jgi:xanthine dehydrogenase accessory factor